MCAFHVDGSDCAAGMESYAAGETGEDAAATELQDENSQRLETVTAMDEEGDIYEVGETDGTVDESSDQSVEDESEDTEPAPKNGIAMFSMRSADIVSMKVVNFNTKGNDTTDFSYSGGSGYTNGAYGADAAYLGTDKSGNYPVYAWRRYRNREKIRGSGAGLQLGWE